MQLFGAELGFNLHHLVNASRYWLHTQSWLFLVTKCHNIVFVFELGHFVVQLIDEAITNFHHIT